MNNVDKLQPTDCNNYKREWNITNAQAALKYVQLHDEMSIKSLALAIISGIAAAFASFFSAPVAITFTAVAFLAGCMYIRFSFRAAALRKELDAQGLTPEKHMQLCVKEFSDELEKMSKQIGPYEKDNCIAPLVTFTNAVNPLFEGILHFNPIGIEMTHKIKSITAKSSTMTKEEIQSLNCHQITVSSKKSKNIEDRLKLDLLNAISKSPFTLLFFEFSMGLLNEHVSGIAAELAGNKFNNATLFSAKYLKMMLDKIDLNNSDEGIAAINAQLDALAFQTYKIQDKQNTVHKFPALALRKNENGQLVVDLTLCGFSHEKNTPKVLEMVGELIPLIDRENLEIRIHMNREEELVVRPEEWKSFMLPYTNSVKYKAKITDALLEKAN